MPALHPKAPSGVLYVSPGLAEWSRARRCGGYAYARIVPAGDEPEDLAAACLEAARQAGDRPDACVLMLGRALLRRRPVDVPRRSRKELSQVLHRKAAGLTGAAPEATCFAALDATHPFTRPEGKPEQKRYWLEAAERQRIDRLRLALRRHGFRVQRALVGHLAYLNALAPKSDGASIAICVEPECASVSLVSDGALLNQDSISGDFLSTPTMAMSLLQDVRSYEAFWRKVSRGQATTRVLVMGLAGEHADLMREALSASLPLVDVEVDAEVGASLPEARARMLLLGGRRGPFTLDFTTPLRMRRTRAGTLAAALAALAAGAGVVGREPFIETLRQVRDQVQDLRAEARDLQRLEDERQALIGDLDRLARTARRNASVGAGGLDVEQLLNESFRACGERAALLSVSASEHSGSGFQLTAVTDPHPVLALRNVAEILDELEAGECLSDVRALPPARLPDGRKDGEPLHFEMRATMEEP